MPVQCTCSHCKKAFFVADAWKARRTTYCSRACKDAAHSFEQACDACGKIIHVQRCRLEYRSRYCDLTCKGIGSRVSPTDLYHRYIVVTPDCWQWKGKADRKGYGTFTTTWSGEKTTYWAHRFSWEMHNGPILNGLHVLHHCDTPSCTNPDHLFLGTHQDNMRDMAIKGRNAHGSRSPSAKLTEESVHCILSMLKSGVPDSEVAATYSVHRRTITDIRLNRTWRHILRP